MMKVKSEMAGTVLEIMVRPGEKIKAGQEVIVLESMKMEVPVMSTVEGEVTTISKKVGDFVIEGETLIELK